MKRAYAILLVAMLIGLGACGGGGAASTADITFGCVGAESCSIDDIIDRASSMDNPTIELTAGEYTISREITSAMTIRSQSASASASVAKATAPAVITCTVPEAAVDIRTSADVTIKASDDSDDTVKVMMTDPEEMLSLEGLKLSAGVKKGSLVVRYGRVIVTDTIIDGRISVEGEEAYVGVYDSVVSTNLSDPEEPTAPTQSLSKATEVYGLGLACRLATLYVGGKATFVAANMEIKDHYGVGACISDAYAMLCGGSIHDITPYASTGRYGRAAVVKETGSLSLRGTKIYDNYETGALAHGTGTTLKLSEGTSISDTRRAAEMTTGLGVAAQSGAMLMIDDVTVQNTGGPGVFVISGAEATIKSAKIDNNTSAGIFIDGATVAVEGSTIQNTQYDPSEDGGVGFHITNGSSTSVDISQSTIDNNQLAGVFVDGDGGTVSVTGSTITNNRYKTIRNGNVMGYGVYASYTCSGISLSGNSYEGNEGAHVFLDGSNATLGGSTYVTNTILDFQQQNCTGCVTPLGPDLTAVGLADPPYLVEICPGSVDPVWPIEFDLDLQEAEAVIGW